MVDIHWIALSLLPKIGAKTMAALMAEFETAENVLEADKETLMQVRGIGVKTAEAIQTIDIGSIEKQIENWLKQDVQIIASYDTAYPKILLALDDAPPTLFVRGNLDPNIEGFALVGTRSPDEKARKLAFNLAKDLAEQGYTIVSGLAHGIDSAAHQGALSAEKGKTVTVLGGGVLNVYPQENEALANRILENGAIIGESHPKAEPKAARLVSRNRIISGLCRHVIVVETGIDGGAMYAAKAAIIQGRKLYTPDFPASGNQDLLKQGAMKIAPDAVRITLS